MQLLEQEKRISNEDWLQMVLSDKDYDAPCSAILLEHVGPTGNGTEVKTVKIGANREWTAHDLAKYIWDLARGYCQDLSGVHTFRIMAFYGSNEPKARHPFTVNGSLDDHGMGSEPATPEGQRRQGMRHQEALIQGMMQERLALLEMPIRQQRMMMEYQQTLMAELAETRRENLDSINIVKEMILKKAVEDREGKIQLLKFERESKEREMALKLGGVALNRVTGQEIIPQPMADTMLIEAMAEGLSEEQVKKLIESGVIPPHILGLVMARFEEVLRKKRERQEEARARGSEAEKDADDDPMLAEKAGPNGSTH